MATEKRLINANVWHIDSPYCPNCGAKMECDGNGN